MILQCSPLPSLFFVKCVLSVHREALWSCLLFFSVLPQVWLCFRPKHLEDSFHKDHQGGICPNEHKNGHFCSSYPKNAPFLVLAGRGECGSARTGPYCLDLQDLVRWTFSKVLKVGAFHGCLGRQIIFYFALIFLLNLLFDFSWPWSISGNWPW